MFKFCPKCGGLLTKKTKTLFICNRCGFHFYQNPKPSNALIAMTGDKQVLLVKRKLNPKKGFWDLPGGFIDLNENIEDSLIREIKEELGITLSRFKYFNSYYDIYRYQKIPFPAICAVFITTLSLEKIAQIKVGDDIKEYKLFSISKIPFDRVAFPSMKMALLDFLFPNR